MTETAKANDIHTALFALQGLLRGIKRDAKNDFHKSKYATLEEVCDTIRPHTQALGIYWTQMPGAVVDGCIEITTRIAHPASETQVEFTMMMPLAKRDPQGTGAAITYACRYALMAVLGLPPRDDDAEMAYDRNNERPDPLDDPTNMPTIPKSSAALKRNNAWENLKAELEQDMLDVHTMVAFEKVRIHYGARAKQEGWNKTFIDQLKEEFAFYRDRVRKGALKEDIAETY